MEFYRRRAGNPQSVAVLAGSFNPPTVAHLELARAASRHVDEIVFVVPRTFPHKNYFGATLDQRLQMLDAMGLPGSHSIASAEKGLFVDIARECRQFFGLEAKLYFVCGRDAAERILGCDYGDPGVVEKMMREFELLVAARAGTFCSPPQFQDRIHELVIQGEHDHVSSSRVRERIAQGEPWEHLVPEPIVEKVRSVYGR
jgi:nicotinate (nicotinamide) nucleotide adenylyltransferase